MPPVPCPAVVGAANQALPPPPAPHDIKPTPSPCFRGILANALLGNVRDVMAERKCNQGGLRFNRLAGRWLGPGFR